LRKYTAAAFEIRLRVAASFQEKLPQLVRNPSTKRATAHDPPKCERFGDQIMRPLIKLERDRTQNRIPLLLIAL
jgi:hypothetical protein